MYAIIQNKNKQYKVYPDKTIYINFIKSIKKGDPIIFDQVLFINDKEHIIGNPLIKKAYVHATIINTGKENSGIKGKKIIVFKKKRRKGYQKTIGYRAKYTEIKINKIVY